VASRRLLRWAAAVLAALALVAAVALGAAWLGLSRVERLDLDLPGSGAAGTTWLLVGSDSRQRLDAEDRRTYADRAQATGERADAMVLLRRDDTGTVRAAAVPRDLFVGAARGAGDRLTTTLLDGPGALAEAYCRDLGIGVDHVVVVDFAALVGLVDAVGGVEVTTATPVRDRRARLDVPTAGRHRLDGAQALAWVRSREPEVLVDGTWRPAPSAGTARADHLADVLGQVGYAASGRPLAAYRALWVTAPRTRADDGMSAVQWGRMVRALRTVERAGGVTVVPARPVDGPVPVAFETPATREALAPFRAGPCPGG
jgi:LCP family protein required for cell wall assembly